MDFDIIYPETKEAIRKAQCIVGAAYFTGEELTSLGVPADAYEVDEVFVDDNEFEKPFKLWDSTKYLSNFFKANQTLFEDEYWKGITEERFVEDVTRSLNRIRSTFMNLFLNNEVYTKVEPLDKTDHELRLYQSIPVKIKQGWIGKRLAFRFYAIEVEEKKCYIITGAAIKIHKDMKKAPNTTIEKAKIDQALKKLRSEGIDTKEEFINYFFS
ncbi:MAG: hypothetical protein K2M06_07445 [Muribaculaceae bacterium]|nr:hypothetical protein [Muribaculaceae bacterium]